MNQSPNKACFVPQATYKNTGLIALSHKNKSLFQFLAAFCKKDKIDVIDLFIQEDLLCVCGISYLTSVHFFYTLKSLNDNSDGLKCSTKEGTPALDIRKPIIRVGTTSDFLYALAIYEEYIVMEVTESEIVLKADGTMLYFDRIRTKSEYEDYLDKITREDISEVSVDNILTMTRSLFTVKEDVYKRYVMLSGNRAYTHTTSFLSECAIKPVKHEYLLTYNMLSVIDKIPRKAFATIGYRYSGGKAHKAAGQCVVLCVSGCYICWDLTAPNTEILNNLMSILNRKKFSHILTINAREWSKLDMLCKFSEKSADDVITIITRNEGVFALYGKNKAYIKGPHQPGVSFDVGLSLIKQARMLSGSKQPEMYVDYTGAQSILILKGEILVTIAISNLKVDSSGFKFAKTLEENTLDTNDVAQDSVQCKSQGYTPEFVPDFDSGFVPSLPDEDNAVVDSYCDKWPAIPDWNSADDDFGMPSELMLGGEL